jgi:hypothetical protein
VLVDIFERIEDIFRRLATYIELPPTTEMMDVIVNVTVQVLLILALATKEFKQGKMSELFSLMDPPLRLSTECSAERFLKKLAGRSDIEDALQRLDKLTQEEHRMATAQDLRATHRVDERVKGVDERVQGVGDRVKVFDDKIDAIIDGARSLRFDDHN